MRETSPSRRALLKAAGAAGTVAALAVPIAVLPKAEAAPADPVFAAIANVDRNYLALENVDRRVQACRQNAKPVCDDLLAEQEAIFDALQASITTVLRTVPTTRAGMLTYLNFVQSPLGWRVEMEEEEVRLFVATVRAFVTKEAHRG